VFFIPKRYKYHFSLFIHLLIILISSYWAFQAFGAPHKIELHFAKLMGREVNLLIDRLSAFFIITINLTMLTGILYARGYLKPYFDKKNSAEFSMHYFSFMWLHISMFLVCVMHDALSFLVVWEIMSLTSFFLVIFDSNNSDTVKTGIKYFIQMHIGFVFLFSAFLIVFYKTGEEFNFESLAIYFEQYPTFPIFLMFFVGFGIKAGFIPLHTWLPHAHPAAPAHVSGVMSGVMIKMGIYGILRVLTFIHSDLFPIGVFIFVISLFSGVVGVILAIVQHDIKKLLAYHSIENIGIIGIGIGIGVIGLSIENNLLAALGFAGGILHIFNHSLFKSLLFYAAGSVYKQTHTLYIEHLGGLIKKMPKTAFFFLIGAIAISGLPPFNGFISEFLIYSGLFKSLYASSLGVSLILLSAIIGLALIGGLAVFCFTKVFGIVFLGNERSHKTENACEVEKSMLLPKFIITLFIVAVGVFPVLMLKPLQDITQVFVSEANLFTGISTSLEGISKVLIVCILIFAIVYFLKKWSAKKHLVSSGPTWGCAYNATKPSVHQYTATSYGDYIASLTPLVTNTDKHFEKISRNEIFPKERSFETHSSDIFENQIITKPTNRLVNFFTKIAMLQNGNLQSYLLYALIYLALILILTLFNTI